MKEEGWRRECFVREFQIREFVPGGEKWSPLLGDAEAVLVSRAIILSKVVFTVSRRVGSSW